MKIENEPLSGHSAFLSKRDSPQFRFMKNNAATPLASEFNEKDVLLNTPELESMVIVEDLTQGTENKIRDTPGFCEQPFCKINKSDKTDVHTEKIIRPSVCYQDNSYAVKDISVDEKVLVKDKLIMDNKNDKNGCIGDKGSVVTKESDSDEFLSPDGSLQSSENDDSNDSQELKSSSESTFLSTGPLDETDSNPTIKRMADVSPREAFNVIPLSQDFSSQKTLKSFLLSSDKAKNESEEPTTKIPCSEVTYGIPGGGLACNNKVDSVTNASEFKYYKLDNGSDEAQQGQGESSLSMAGTSSGRITYSGPMLVYSGSVSIRSDSSSTRSFAFPILQPEWHTSPIKMAKPDRRQNRKQGGWKQSLICCRF